MAAFVAPLGMPAMQQAMAAEGGCHESDPGTKHVCIKSCQDEPQKNEVPALAALPPSEMHLRVALPATAGASRCVAPTASILARATAPPLRLLFSRFLE
jgi:hypothetical protein